MCRQVLRTEAKEMEFNSEKRHHVTNKTHYRSCGLPRWSRQPETEQAGYPERVVYDKDTAFSLSIYVSIYAPLVPSRACIFILRVPCNSVGILCSTASETYARRACKVAQLSPRPSCCR